MARERFKKLRGASEPAQRSGEARGRGREDKILVDLAQFADQVVVIVEKMRDAVVEFAADRYDRLAEAADELGELESRADDAKADILDRLAYGSLFPMHRADLARLVASVDSIANLATGAVDRISMRRFSLPASMNDQLVAMAEVDVEAARGLRDAVVAVGRDLREAIRLAALVDESESRADDLFAELYKDMYELDTDFKTFHQLKAIIERLENVADRCCENAELIRHLALEYLENE